MQWTKKLKRDQAGCGYKMGEMAGPQGKKLKLRFREKIQKKGKEKGNQGKNCIKRGKRP